MENWVSPARFPWKSPRGCFFLILEPCRNKLKYLKAFLLGDIGVGIPPDFNSVFSRVDLLRVLLFFHSRRTKFSLCVCVLGDFAAAFHPGNCWERSKGQAGTSKGPSGRRDKERSLSGARGAWEGNPGGKGRADLVGKQRGQSLSLGSFPSTEPPLAASG